MKLPLKTLCLAIAIVNMQSAFALESLDDETMSETTGEGIALLPENYSFMMNGANPSTGLYTDNSGAGTYGTGYMRFIPVGPLTSTATNNDYQKADIWLYGLSLAQSKKNYDSTIDGTDWGVPFGAISATPAATDFGRTITSWGTAANPWVVKTVTDTTVPNFSGATKSVTYLGLEAPLYNTAAISSLPVAEQSAYNLKLGYWMDLFMRNAAVADSGTTAELSNRLRLAFAWNGFGMNGSNFKIFQTLDGASAGSTYSATLKETTNSNNTLNAAFTVNVTNAPYTFNTGTSTSYNQTFGMAGLFRLNSRPTDTVRATVGLGNITRQIIQLDYYPVRNYNSATKTRAGLFVEGAALKTNIVASGIGTMTAADADSTNNAPTYTPHPGGTITTTTIANNNATNDAAAHSIGLDQTYVPMTNTSLRGPTTDPDAASSPANPHPLATFPYIESYPGDFFDDAVCSSPTTGNRGGDNQFGQCLNNEGFTTRRFKASTVNSWTPPDAKSVMRISTQELLGGTFGSGTPALGGATGTVPDFRPNTTPEGIFIYDLNVNLVLGNLYQPVMLSTEDNNFSFEIARIPNIQDVYKKIYTRYEHIDPAASVDVGVVYEGSTCNIYRCGTHPVGTNVTISGNYQASTATHSSISIGATNYDAGNNLLTAEKGVASYGISFGQAEAQTGLASQTFVDYTQVWNRTRTYGTVQTSASGCGFLGNSPCTEERFLAWDAWTAVGSKPALTGQPHPSLNITNPYETTFNQNYNNQLLGIQTTMPVSNMAGTINNLTPVGASATNNFGSAVIDGLLIQHLKFSTTGL